MVCKFCTLLNKKDILMILIGSKAIKFHVPEWREPLDSDLVGTYEEVERYQRIMKPKVCYPINSGSSVFMKASDTPSAKGQITEIEVAWEGSRAEKLIKFVESDPETKEWWNVKIPSLDVLYMLKCSHKYKKDSPHFLKTLRDIQALEKLGCKIREEHIEFFKERERDTYTNVLPKLNQSKVDFFDNSNGIYSLDHDGIHWAVKHLDKPAYEYFKPDSAEVMTSKEMFFACSREVQLYAAYEEICVLSLERAIHPFPHVDKRAAFDKAHMKLATSISSGWFRKFVYDEYDAIQSMYNVEYVDRFYEALNNGQIRPFKEEA